MLDSIKSSVSGFIHKRTPEIISRLYLRLNKKVRLQGDVTPHLRKAPPTETTPPDTSLRARKVTKTKESKTREKAQKSFDKLMEHMLNGDADKAAKELVKLHRNMTAWSVRRPKEDQGDGSTESRSCLRSLCNTYKEQHPESAQLPESLVRGGKAYNTLGALVFCHSGETGGKPVYTMFRTSVTETIASTAPLFDELFEQFFDPEERSSLKDTFYDDTDSKKPKIDIDYIKRAYEAFKQAR